MLKINPFNSIGTLEKSLSNKRLDNNNLSSTFSLDDKFSKIVE